MFIEFRLAELGKKPFFGKGEIFRSSGGPAIKKTGIFMIFDGFADSEGRPVAISDSDRRYQVAQICLGHYFYNIGVRYKFKLKLRVQRDPDLHQRLDFLSLPFFPVKP